MSFGYVARPVAENQRSHPLSQLDSKEFESQWRRLSLGSLGAAYFCKRDEITSNQPRLMIPTVAFRLASAIPLLKQHIIAALQADPDVAESPITNQFHKLIVDPLSELPQNLVLPPLVIVIDALDECGDPSTRQSLLRCLPDARCPPVWFKLLVTSRPEPYITSYLTGLPSGHKVDTSSDESVADIRAYTTNRIVSLRADRKLGDEWPGESNVKQLITHARGLFIWTALSFNFIANHRSPTKALQLVLTPSGQSHMAKLYHTVLIQGSASEVDLTLIRSILGFIVVSKSPLPLPGICTLLDISLEEGTWARDSLASVLPNDSQSLVRVIHPSFLDFLTDRSQSNEFYINVEEHSLSLARGVLRVMNGMLRTNICRLTDTTLVNDEIHDLASRLDDNKSPFSQTVSSSLPYLFSSSESPAATLFLPAQVLDGWVLDVYGRKVLWISAHLRGDNPAALYHTSVVWFDSKPRARRRRRRQYCIAIA
jgi:hypothetical protein